MTGDRPVTSRAHNQTACYGRMEIDRDGWVDAWEGG